MATRRVPSAPRYKIALTKLAADMPPNHRRMLVANYAAPNHTISVKQLAKAVGYQKASMQYGILGHRLGDMLDFIPEMKMNNTPVWANVIAIGPPDRSTDSWEWKLRPQVIQALEELGWVGGDEGQHAYVLTWNPDGEFCWDDKDDNVEWYIQQTAKGKKPAYTWSTGNTKSVSPGDRLYLFRQGRL